MYDLANTKILFLTLDTSTVLHPHYFICLGNFCAMKQIFCSCIFIPNWTQCMNIFQLWMSLPEKHRIFIVSNPGQHLDLCPVEISLTSLKQCHHIWKFQKGLHNSIFRNTFLSFGVIQSKSAFWINLLILFNWESLFILLFNKKTLSQVKYKNGLVCLPKTNSKTFYVNLLCCNEVVFTNPASSL